MWCRGVEVLLVAVGAARAAIVALLVVGSASAAPRPACKVELAASSGAVSAKVGGRHVSLDKVDGEPQELRIYPADSGAVLVAYASRGEHGPYGGDTLWRVPCKTGTPEPFAHLDGADFGHSVLSPDGRTLFFTGPDGILSLDVATRATRRLTRAALAYCARNHVPTRDVVAAFRDPHTLSFERGCGYEHEWNASLMVLRNPGTPKMVVEGAPRPPFPSADVDGAGGVWLSDGLCGDRSTYGRVLFSADQGEHWRKVPVKMFSAQPARQVIADRVKRGSLLVFTFACGSSEHVEPGWIYLTDDGGKTFHPIVVPEGITKGEGGMPEGEQDPIAAVVAPDGTLAHLLLYGESRLVAGADGLGRWESRDGGRTWKPLAPVAAAPKPPPTSVASGDWEFSIRNDGLYRSHNGAPADRVYPPN